MEQIEPLDINVDKASDKPDNSKNISSLHTDAISLSYSVNTAISRFIFYSDFISTSPLSFFQTIPNTTVFIERDMISPFDEAIQYNDTELEMAIKKLNFPTWARAYVHCSDRRSEIKCGQVIKAYRKILEWEEIVQKSPKDDSSPLLVHF